MLSGALNPSPRVRVHAWVNFSGSAPTIGDSHNVSSVTRGSTGVYSVTLAVALASAYACAPTVTCINVGSTENTLGSLAATPADPVTNTTAALTTALGTTPTATDPDVVCVVFVGSA